MPTVPEKLISMEKNTRFNHVHSPGANRCYSIYLFVLLCFVGFSLQTRAMSIMTDRITVQPSSIPVITGPDTVCINIPGYVYTTDAGMSDYVWTISSGGVITSGTNTNSIEVSWLQPGQGLVTVTYASATSPGTFEVDILPDILPAITIVPDNNPVCAGSPVTFTANITGGGSTPVFQWNVNGVSVGSNSDVLTYTPSNGDAVNCILLSNAPCTTAPQVVSSTVVMVVNAIQQSGVFIYASSNPVCQGTTVNFSAVPQNGGTAPVYQWKVNGTNTGSNSSVMSLIPNNGDLVVCEMTSDASCIVVNPVVSNPVQVTVSPTQVVSVSVTSSANPVCVNNPVTFTANPVNGGNIPQYNWKVNNIPAGTGNASFSYIPSDGDAVTCQLTSNASCATGNPAVSSPVLMTVHQIIPVSLSIQASATTICQGMPVTVDATPVNGGASPVFQWILNGFPVGTNGPSYTYIPANGDVIMCKLFSSLSCPSATPAISNTLTMTVNPNVPVSISISSSANPVCIFSSVTLTANPFNTGTSPIFEWRVNGATVGSNSLSYTFVPNNGDQVVCLMTSNASCAPTTPAVSNTVTMTVSPQLPASVSVVSSANPVCQNVQVVFTATAVNGGSSPSYLWKVNGIAGGSNNPLFTYTPVDGDQVECVMTSNSACISGNPATSNSIQMEVVPSVGVPVGVTVTPSANPSCVGQTVTYTASAVNGGTAPVYAWTVNGLDVGTNSPVYSYLPSTGDFVRCWVTSDLTCATNNPASSNEIAMVVNPYVPVSVSVIASANPCCTGSMVTFTANGVNPGSAPVYQWKVNGVNAGSNQNTLTFAPELGNVVSCKLTSSLGCTTGNPASSNSITMNVMPVLPVDVTISTLTNPSCQATQVKYQATPVNGGTAPAYQWKINGSVTGTNNPLLILTPASGDLITCRLTSNALCYTGSKIVTSAPITQVVSQELVPAVNISASANPFCQGSAVTYTAVPTNGGTIPVYQWKVNCLPVGTNSPIFTYNPLDGDFVVCQMTSNLSCAVMNPCKSNGIFMKRNTQTPAGITISASANPVCPATTTTFFLCCGEWRGNPGLPVEGQWKQCRDQLPDVLLRSG